jgi:helix-turn-helix protein
MSSMAIQWVKDITVGNQTAKQLLQFLACHNFHKPGFFFKIETLAKQLEVSERAIQKAFRLLESKNLVRTEKRFDSAGRQMTNVYYLNVPDEYIENYWGEGEQRAPLGVNNVQGEGALRSPSTPKKSGNSSNKSKTSKKSDFPNNNIKTNNNINSKREGKKPSPALKKIPKNFSPNEENRLLASERNVDLEEELFKFKDHYKARGEVMADWYACFNGWLRKVKQFAAKPTKEEDFFSKIARENQQEGKTYDEHGRPVDSLCTIGGSKIYL